MIGEITITDEQALEYMRKTIERAQEFTIEVNSLRKQKNLSVMEFAFFTTINYQAAIEAFPGQMKMVDDFLKKNGV